MTMLVAKRKKNPYHAGQTSRMNNFVKMVYDAIMVREGYIIDATVAMERAKNITCMLQMAVNLDDETFDG
jgi:hypothetical protein